MFNNSPYFKRVNRSVADSALEKVMELDGAKLSRVYAPDDSKKLKSSKYLNSSKSVDSLVSQEGVSFNPVKNLNNVAVKATCFGLFTNVVFSYLSKNYNAGYIAESAGYTLWFTLDYLHTNKKSGQSKEGVSIDTILLGAASFLLSVGPYRIGKNDIIDYSIKNHIVSFIHDPDMARAFASGTAQLLLLSVWMPALQLVKKGIDYFDNKFEFKDKLVDFYKRINKNARITKTDKSPKFTIVEKESTAS